MSAPYLHGIETKRVKKGRRSVRVVKSAVIGLVGTAPKGSVNTMTWVRSDTDDAQFGAEIAGFTIPQALAAIRKKISGVDVLVVNVCDPATHQTAVAAEEQTFALNKVKLANRPVVGAVVVKSQDGVTTYQASDYVLDAQAGTITRTPASTIPATATVQVDYTHVDPAKVIAGDIIGGIDPDTELAYGMRLLKGAKPTFGFGAKLVIAPGYSTLDSVAAELLAQADQNRWFPGLDAPVGTTISQAVAGRGPMGDINFDTANGRTKLLFPHLKVYDRETDADRLEAYSAHWAGLVAKVHQEEGYWVSESNHELPGVTGVERPISFALNDPACDANVLNENGITTVAMGFGTGIRCWGNRTAAWPNGDPTAESFFAVQMMLDIAAESIEDSLMPYLDKGITQALIDSIVDTVNAFYRVCVSRGAVVDAKCYFDPAKNPADQIANAGHLVFSHDIAPSVPLERMTHEQAVDLELLAKAFGVA